MASATEVIASARTLLAGFPDVVGAFVYGSVAHGTAGPASDVDLFVVTDGAPREGDRLREAAAALQRRLGYRPDPDHPVEVFAVSYCEAALSGPRVAHALDAVATGRDIDPDLLQCDDLEILRALSDQRADVLTSPVVDDLTERGRLRLTAAAGRLGVPTDRVLAALGIARAGGVAR